jgi:hypothetical protein
LKSSGSVKKELETIEKQVLPQTGKDTAASGKKD